MSGSIIAAGIYNATTPTYTDGQGAPIAVDAYGNLKTQASPNLFAVSATFTPAATSHTGLDCVGGAVTFTVPNGAVGRFFRVHAYNFSMATTTPVTTVWTAFLFGSTPTVIADDAAFVIAAADGAKLIGYIPIAQTVDFTSTWQQVDTVLAAPKPVGPLVTSTVTAYLQLTTTSTLEAVAHKLTLFCELC